MKTLQLLLFALVSPLLLLSQQGINYQAVVRNSNGSLLINQNVTAEFTIKESTANGTAIYTESHSTSSNDYGLINVIVGDGTPSLGIFADIDWGADRHFLEVKINGTTMGTIEFQWVPYSLHAQTLTNIKTNTGIADLEMTSEDAYALLHLRPTVGTSNDSSAIFFGEGKDYRNGMAITYDGVANELKVSGRTIVSNTGVSLTIERNSSTAIFTKGVEVKETTTSPARNTAYGNSMPLAYGLINLSGNIRTDYGVQTATSTSTGVYIIILDNNFVGDPVVIATSFNSTSDTEIITHDYSIPNKITFRIVNENNSPIATAFSFVVFGTAQ
jgi:hypothetical protein